MWSPVGLGEMAWTGLDGTGQDWTGGGGGETVEGVGRGWREGGKRIGRGMGGRGEEGVGIGIGD